MTAVRPRPFQFVRPLPRDTTQTSIAYLEPIGLQCVRLARVDSVHHCFNTDADRAKRLANLLLRVFVYGDLIHCIQDTFADLHSIGDGKSSHRITEFDVYRPFSHDKCEVVVISLPPNAVMLMNRLEIVFAKDVALETLQRHYPSLSRFFPSGALTYNFDCNLQSADLRHKERCANDIYENATEHQVLSWFSSDVLFGPCSFPGEVGPIKTFIALEVIAKDRQSTTSESSYASNSKCISKIYFISVP